MPSVLPVDEAAADVAEELHKWLAYATLVLALGHAGAAVRHHLRGEESLRRMWF